MHAHDFSPTMLLLLGAVQGINPIPTGHPSAPRSANPLFTGSIPAGAARGKYNRQHEMTAGGELPPAVVVRANDKRE